MADEPYWEISGPRKYLNIPTVVPDKWRAQVTVGELGDTKTFTAWGPSQFEACERAAKMAGIEA